MSVYRGMAIDGGFGGDEIDQVAAMLEQEHREQIEQDLHESTLDQTRVPSKQRMTDATDNDVPF